MKGGLNQSHETATKITRDLAGKDNHAAIYKMQIISCGQLHEVSITFFGLEWSACMTWTVSTHKKMHTEKGHTTHRQQLIDTTHPKINTKFIDAIKVCTLGKRPFRVPQSER